MSGIILFSVSADVFCLLLCVITVTIVLLWRQAERHFTGEYMAGYSWGETTLGALLSRKRE